MTAMTPSKRFG